MTALRAAVAKPSRNKPAISCNRACMRPSWCAAVVWAVSVLPAGAQPSEKASTAPRLIAGRPDLNGIWQALNTAAWDIEDHVGQLGVPPGLGVVEGNELPYQPWAAKKREENAAQRKTSDPAESDCFLPGVPHATYLPYPFEIVQTPARMAIRYEFAHALRTIPLDGSPHPDGLPDAWMGDSRGHWEGATLVVDVRNLDERTWFDQAGNFHSDALHVVERYSLTDSDHMLYEATVEDPKVFTRPWKMRMPLYRLVDPKATLLEYECVFYLQEQRYKNAPFH